MAATSKIEPGTARRLPPNAGKGKPKGAVNKTTATLKEAILLAGEQSGNDGNGKGGLVGYLRRVADTDVKAFSGLLGKVLPMQVTGSLDVTTMTKEQRDAAVAAALRADT